MQNPIFKKTKEHLLSEGILVPQNNEEEFLHENNLIFKRLENGAKIIAAQREVEDSRYSSIGINMLSGSYFDPEGQEGAHHFLEHLFFSDALLNLYHENLVENNAFTNRDRVTYFNGGIFNLEKKDFGLEKVLDSTVQSLIKPSPLFNSEKFEFYRNVIMNEIDEFRANYQNVVSSTFNKILFSSRNPYHDTGHGTKKSVKNITAKDIEELLHRQFSSTNMLVGIFSDGSGGESEELSSEVENLIKDFPRSQQVEPLDWSLSSEMNSLDKSRYEEKIGLNTNLVTIHFVWKMDIEYYSDLDLAFSLLGTYLNEQFFLRGRAQGIGYSLGFYEMPLIPAISLGVASVVCSASERELVEKKAYDVLQELINDLLQNSLIVESLLERERNRQLAQPIQVRDRLDNNIFSLTHFDTLFDTAKFRKRRLNQKAESLQSVLSMLQSQDPIRLIIGDL